MTRRGWLPVVWLLVELGLATRVWCQGPSRANDRLVRVTRAWPVMGTMLVITAWVTDSSAALPMLFGARDSVRLVDSLMSTYRSSSDLSRVNAAAGRAPVPVARQTMAVLRKSRLYWRLSGGAFDPTVGPLIRAWGFEGARGRQPPASELDSLRRLVGFGEVELDSSRSTVRLPRAGMRIDLGGIAKGFALDLARGALRSDVIRAGTIDLGGNLLLFGRPPGGAPWYVEIVDPLRRNQVVGGFTIDSGAVATSGDYEHYVVVQGRRYGHLIDPRTGRPSRGVLSATAIGPLGEWSDGLSATLFLLGPVRGSRLADSLPYVDGIWIIDAGRNHVSPRDVICTRRIARRFVSSMRAAGERAAGCRSVRSGDAQRASHAAESLVPVMREDRAIALRRPSLRRAARQASRRATTAAPRASPPPPPDRPARRSSSR